MRITDLLFLGFALFIVVQSVRIVCLVVARNFSKAAQTGASLALFTVCYSAILFGVALCSHAQALEMGEEKCFDEWCISLSKTQPTGSGEILTLKTHNKGRRPQSPDHPKLFLDANRSQTLLELPWLYERLDGREVREHCVFIPRKSEGERVKLVPVEGGWPSKLVIGDDNSPFHAKPYWVVAR